MRRRRSRAGARRAIRPLASSRLPGRRPRVAVAVLLAAALLAACGSDPGGDEPTVDPEHRAAVQSWRADRDAGLRRDDGWLSLVGLHWLEPGDNVFGSGPGAAIRLPADRAAARVGVFRLAGETVTVVAAEEAGLTVEGHPVSTLQLRSDADGQPDVLHLGSLRLHVIRRDDRFAVRVKDTESPLLREFAGMSYFPVRTRYRVRARWQPYDTPQPRDVPTVVGTTTPMLAPGRAFFTLDDTEMSLEPVVSSLQDDELFFIFSDATSGKETYGAGRFLYADRPEGGVVVLDFNKAYNPPCVFTPYATCPLPPPGNTLDARIEAGEKNWGPH